MGKHLTGFDDEVQLGQLGEILENDSAVMSVELFDREWKRLAPDPEADSLWRGVSMERYEKGRWRRPEDADQRIHPEHGRSLGRVAR